VNSSLNDDEKFVIESLASSLGGSWRPGEDPPDTYLIQGDIEVAIEISTLAQHVTSKHGRPEPRLSQDMGLIRICDELNEELTNLGVSDKYLILQLNAPVDKQRKFKRNLKDKLLEIIKTDIFGKISIDVNGHNIKVDILRGSRPSGKRIIGIIPNKNSCPQLSSNVEYILHQRISEKTKKCDKIIHCPLWLALFNDYWIANSDSYLLAMQKYSELHPFEKILLISGNRKITTIFEK